MKQSIYQGRWSRIVGLYETCRIPFARMKRAIKKLNRLKKRKKALHGLDKRKFFKFHPNINNKIGINMIEVLDYKKLKTDNPEAIGSPEETDSPEAIGLNPEAIGSGCNPAKDKDLQTPENVLKECIKRMCGGTHTASFETLKTDMEIIHNSKKISIEKLKQWCKEQGRACKHCGRPPVLVKVKIPADLSSTGKVKWKRALIDACIAPIVQALQKGGIDMRGSCCGHGAGLGDIHLQDDRVLVIIPGRWYFGQDGNKKMWKLINKKGGGKNGLL